MANFLSFTLVLLCIQLTFSCISPLQSQGKCTACVNGVQILVKGYCYEQIIGCLQYDVGPICVSCQPGYRQFQDSCERIVLLQQQGPAPLAANFDRPLTASEIIGQELNQKNIIETLKSVQNLETQKQYIQIKQTTNQSTPIQIPTQNISNISNITQVIPKQIIQNTVLQNKTQSIKTNETMDNIIHNLFSLYPLLQSPSAYAESKGNGFYVLYYANKTSLSFQFKNNYFILNRPIITSISGSTFGQQENGYSLINGNMNRVDLQVWDFAISQFEELRFAPILEAYRKQDLLDNYDDLYYKFVFKVDEYYYELGLYRSEKGQKQLLSAQKIKQPIIIYSTNYNYNLDRQFFSHYNSLEGSQFSHTNGILFVTKRILQNGLTRFKVVYENQNILEFSIDVKGDRIFQRYLQRKTPSVADAILEKIYQKYPELDTERPVVEKRQDNVYVFYFGSNTTVSAFMNDSKIIINQIYREKQEANRISLKVDVLGTVLKELISYIQSQIPQTKGTTIIKAEYYVEDGKIIYKIILLSSTYQYKLLLSKSLTKGPSLIQAVKMSHIDPNQSEIIYSINYNYNTDRKFFSNYLKALRIAKISQFHKIKSVLKVKYVQSELYLVSYEDAPLLQYFVNSEGVKLA